jgi:hypothetical protein
LGGSRGAAADLPDRVGDLEEGLLANAEDLAPIFPRGREQA